MRQTKPRSPAKAKRPRSSSLWLLTATLAAAAANACLVPEFKSDGRLDGSGGLGGDGTDQSVGTGGATSGGSGGTSSGGSSGGTQGDGGGSQGDGGSPGDGGNGTGGGGTGGEASGGSGSGGESSVGEGPSDLPAPPGPSNLPKPDGTPGDLTVIDWAGFAAAVTYSFDDNDVSQLDHYADLQALGGRYTFFLVTGGFGVAINDPRWQTVYEDGHEIGNHTADHVCDDTGILEANTAIETTFGEKPSTLAAPNGVDSCQSQAVGKVFLNRDVSPTAPILPLDDTDPFALNCYIPSTNQATATFNANIDAAVTANGWIIYVIHGFAAPAYNPFSWDALEPSIIYAKDHNLWIDTLENIGAYWLGQKIFADALSNTEGGSTTWTWTLPDQFPSEKYLRVIVDGGTLTQNGQPVIWDPHGYYEIALDELSVTLGP